MLKYSELVESGAKESEVQAFLVDGDTVPASRCRDSTNASS